MEALVSGARPGGVRAGRARERACAARSRARAALGQEGSRDRALKKLLGAERLSVTAKVALVRQTRSAFGLAPALAAVGLARSTWYYRQQRPEPYAARYAALRRPLERIARTHPEYGYRRTTTELRERLGQRVNHKVVRKLHQLWGLPLLRRTRPPRPSAVRRVIAHAGDRANLVTGLAASGPLQVLFTDFTELAYARGKAWLMALVDHRTKVVPGWAVAARADTVLALAAWQRARRWLRQHGFPIAGVIVHHDQDPVYTGYRWIGQLLVRDHARLSYALAGCRDNPAMESFHSRFKTENRSLFLDAQTLADLQRIVAQRMAYYNGRRRHSSLGNQPPLVYLSGLHPE
ncbi:MAG TPA: IS3 family transposase [Candidatus Acidoferrales bacterium]|nr:IS3 family transposase [Candidatus Acidoferrales bacterium]